MACAGRLPRAHQGTEGRFRGCGRTVSGGTLSVGRQDFAWPGLLRPGAGLACPRDSDLQELSLGKLSSLASLRRGDLLFWKGHVAIARDPETLIHANAHHMMVAIEPPMEANARINATGSEMTAVKRVA